MRLVPGEFVGASGRVLPFKIECSGKSREEWQVIADACLPRLPAFGHVVGVPRGGLPLAQIMRRYITPGSKILLVVEDVWTTGGSMKAFAQDYLSNNRARFKEWQGLVAYSRYRTPVNVLTFMQLMV